MKLKIKMLSLFLFLSVSFIFAGTPRELNSVNVSDRSFTITWYTDQSEQGYIEWGSTIPNKNAYDLRGANISDNIHMVTVEGLQENQTYYFRVKSGGETYLNKGQDFEVKTGISSHLPGELATLENVYKINSTTQSVSNDVLVFARAVNGLGEYSLPRAIMYKNSPDSFDDYLKGYRTYFDLNSFRSDLGVSFSDPKNIELVAWTASEGFGFNEKVTINYAPATFNIYLNTANLVFFEGASTVDPIIPTVDPVVPTEDTVTISGILLENFDLTPEQNELGGYNYKYNNNNSNLIHTLTSDGANGSNKSMKIDYNLQGLGDVYAGYGLDFSKIKAENDLTQYSAILFYAKGTGSLAIELETTTDVINDNNHYYKAIDLSSEWQEYIIPLSQFKQNEDWGAQVDLVTALKRMIAVKFKAYPQIAGTNGEFQIDEIYFITGDMGDLPTPGYLISQMLDNFDVKWDDANFFGGYNYVYDDSASPNYGNSTVTISVSTDGANGSAKSVFISYTIGYAYEFPFVGFGLDVTFNEEVKNNEKVTKNTIDLTLYKGIEFYAKGINRLSIQIGSPLYATWNDYVVDLGDLNSDWTLYRIPFSDFRQPKWGEQVTFNDVMQMVDSIKFKVSEAFGSGYFMLDQVKFIADDVPSILVDSVGTMNVATTEGSLDRTISWTKPANATGVIVVRTTDNYAVNLKEGTVIYKGDAETFVVDNSPLLDYMVEYIYTIYAYDSAKRYSEPVTASSVLFEKGTLITNFDVRGLDVNSWGGAIYVYDDTESPNFGSSEITMNLIDDGGNVVAHVSYDIKNTITNNFSGIGFSLDVISNNAQDISKFSGVKFRAKGIATINVEIDSTVYSVYNRHYSQVKVDDASTWKTYSILFTSMNQEAWGNQEDLIDVLKNALAVQLKLGKANNQGELYIDDVEFFYATPQKVQNLSAEVVGTSSLLKWKSSIGASGYLVVRNVVDYPFPGSFPETTIEGVSFVVTTNKFNEPLDEGKAYYYSVFAYNDQIDAYSDVTKADKPLRLAGGLFTVSVIATVDETVLYTQEGSPTISLRDGDYVSSNVALIVTIDVDPAMVTTNSTINVVVRVGGVTLNTVGFIPSTINNRVIIPVNFQTTGPQTVEIVVVDWYNDESAPVARDVVVSSVKDKVGLKPGSHILCYPMPYNPNKGAMDISYELTKEGEVFIYVYNMLGQLVWKNIYYQGLDGGRTGYNQVGFNGTDAFGSKLSVGMYFIQIVHGKSVLGTSKFLVTR